MKHLAPACFRAFTCAGGSCPDSCCRAGWEIVPDEETLKLYQQLESAEGARIRAGITPGVEPLLRQDQSRVCVLLDADGLCCVQKHFGHGALCRVCREYPRFHREFGGLTEHGLSLSCPTAYALATGSPPAWEEWEDEAPPVPNELDPDRYLRLRKGRELVLDLLAREDLPFWQRIALVRKLAAAMQGAPERIVHHDYSIRLRRWETLPPHCRDKHCLSAFAKQTIADRQSLDDFTWGFQTTNRLSDQICLTANAFVPNAGQAILVPTQESGAAALARRFLALEILSPDWRDALERFAALTETGTAERRPCRPGHSERSEESAPPSPVPCCLLPAACCLVRAGNRRADRPRCGGERRADCPRYTGEDPEVYARWLWYELYKYWLDALDDGMLLARVDRSLAMLLLGIAMDRALPGEGPFLRRISREVEHCEENLTALLDAP